MKTKATILIVDDNEDIRLLLNHSLESAGYITLCASGPAEAMTLLRRDEKPDLILSDIQMPDISGIELARILADELPDIPVILMSGHTSLEKAELKALGVRSFISKPFEMDVLKSFICDCLEIHRILGRSA